MSTRLHLVGAGNLGGALLQAWVKSAMAEDLIFSVSEPKPSAEVLALCHEHQVPLNEPKIAGIDICVLAIKPQSFASVLPSLDCPQIERAAIVSLAAGISVAAIKALLPNSTEIIRAMPNLPAAIGQGVTLLAGDPSAPRAKTVTELFSAVGKTVWTKNEDQLDRLMGISGCGPAYIFLLAEVLESVAARYGAEPSDARTLAEATIIGAANHLALSGQPAADLRRAVTSPGGTTAEALGVLQSDPSLSSLMKAAVDAAYVRAHALSRT